MTASQRNWNTALPCSFSVCVTVKTRSTKRKPFSLWQPKEIFRHRTRLRRIRSARLLVGCTPSLRTNVHSDSSNRSTLAQNLAVFPSGHNSPFATGGRTFFPANASGGATQPGQTGLSGTGATTQRPADSSGGLCARPKPPRPPFPRSAAGPVSDGPSTTGEAKQESACRPTTGRCRKCPGASRPTRPVRPVCHG